MREMEKKGAKKHHMKTHFRGAKRYVKRTPLVIFLFALYSNLSFMVGRFKTKSSSLSCVFLSTVHGKFSSENEPFLAIVHVCSLKCHQIFSFTPFLREGGVKEKGRKSGMKEEENFLWHISEVQWGTCHRYLEMLMLSSFTVIRFWVKKSVERLLAKELSDDMSPFVASFGRQWSGIIASLFREKDYLDRVGVFGSLWTGSSHLSTPSEMLIVSRKKGSLCWRTLFFLAMTSTRRSFP